MPINSREKGKKGEREISGILRSYGYDTRRGVQYNGADGSADVIGLPFCHLEIKRVERLNIEDAMSQSIHDARDGEMPVVMHRKNRCSWLVTMKLDDWINLYREYESGKLLEAIKNITNT